MIARRQGTRLVEFTASSLLGAATSLRCVCRQAISKNDIHPSAIVSAHIEDDAGICVGPFSVIGPDVKLGRNVNVGAHTVVTGHTVIEQGTHIFPFACIGNVPPDRKYRGSDTMLKIGRDCVIREHVTIHLGTELGGWTTSIGDKCLIMAGAHVAHDCKLGNNIVIANQTCLGGHVQVGDGVTIGGQVGVKQFVRVGRGAMIGGQSVVRADVIPFGLVHGDPARLAGLNLVGMKRSKHSRERVKHMLSLYRYLFAHPGSTLPSSSFARPLPLPPSPTLAGRAEIALAYIREQRERMEVEGVEGEVVKEEGNGERGEERREGRVDGGSANKEEYGMMEEQLLSFVLRQSRGVCLPSTHPST
mmetsp:Transcript_25726/g.64792  ORF Transcript_25726/g.64792 Transcript_25726/m.64792 type:complete len:360 (-) Transcript_25726:264-1343(-)